ncbi:MAG: dihydropteroate synthase [Pseudomonadota bacterium]|nr:dihydropteroate synthase [Pseudomonadota bacterium]
MPLSRLNELLNSKRPLIMGVLNVTPDSFSDGGQFNTLEQALQQAETMINEGTDILDIGGESTRPGAAPVSVEEELDRTIAVIDALATRFDVALSIDTSTPAVMKAAAAAGVDLINDVRALKREGALEAAVKTQLPVCLMHMQGEPTNMQENPNYQDVINDVQAFLDERVAACQQAGIPKERLLLDPGFGFGKTLTQNYQLLAHLDRFHVFGLPLLVGMSRKSMIGQLVDQPVDHRLAGSLALATLAMTQGAKILRVHDVFETKQAAQVTQFYLEQGQI